MPDGAPCNRRTPRRRRVTLMSSMLLMVSFVAVLVVPQAAATAPPAVQITTTSPLPGVTTGQPYSVQIEATGGTQPYTFFLSSGADYPLPPGLSMSSSGLISGTAGAPPVNLPTTYTILVNVQDANDNMSSSGFSITLTPLNYVSPPTPLEITTTSIPDATFNTGYSFQMQATGGTTPYYWSATNLPQGFAMSESGVLSGSNPLPEQAAITVYIADSGFGYSNGYGVNSTVPGQQHAQQNYTFTVTSGYPQLDPTFFELSAALAPYNPTTIVDELEASLVDEVDSLVSNVNSTVTGLVGDATQSLANEACGVWYQLGLNQELGLAGPACPLGAL